MQRESVNQKRGVSARNWIVWLAVLIAAPATLLVAWRFGNRKYYLSSMLLIVYAMLPFFVRFEHKKPQARELVTVFFLGKPIEEKLDRIKVKYGMMGGDEDEI